MAFLLAYKWGLLIAYKSWDDPPSTPSFRSPHLILVKKNEPQRYVGTSWVKKKSDVQQWGGGLTCSFQRFGRNLDNSNIIPSKNDTIFNHRKYFRFQPEIVLHLKWCFGFCLILFVIAESKVYFDPVWHLRNYSATRGLRVCARGLKNSLFYQQNVLLSLGLLNTQNGGLKIMVFCVKPFLVMYKEAIFINIYI